MKSKAISAFDRTEDIVLVAMFATMVAVIFYQVIMRYIFNNSSSWSEEFGKFLFVWLSWLGISIGARRGEHIKITMLTDKLPFKAAQWVNILSEIILIAICGVTARYSVMLVITQYNVHYAGIKISMSWGYLAVLAGCVLMCIRCMASIYSSLYAIGEGPKEIETEEGGEV